MNATAHHLHGVAASDRVEFPRLPGRADFARFLHGLQEAGVLPEPRPSCSTPECNWQGTVINGTCGRCLGIERRAA